MGHLLATVNREAAEAIDNPPPLPDVATMVVFVPRAGVSRMHRTEFPAIVLAGNIERQTLTLLVIMEPEDMIEETHVPFQSHHQTAFCWRHVRGSGADLEARIAKLEEVLDGEDELVGRVEAVESVLASDEIEQIEARVAKLEKAAKKAK